MMIMFIAMLINYSCGTTIPYNLPKVSPCAVWDSNGTVIVDSSAEIGKPNNIFIGINNTLYVSSVKSNRVSVWSEGQNGSSQIISDGLQQPNSLFVSVDGDIYVDNGAVNGRVDKWIFNTNGSVPIMNVTSSCRSLFIDKNNTLYCSHDAEHQVVKAPMNSRETIAAGNGTKGAEAYMLDNPQGIFVDTQFDLYVADCGNNRIQLFRPDQKNGTTVAGKHAPETIALHCPVGVILDADGYLFIVDQGNRRIIGSGPTGFRCLIGCSSQANAATDQLEHPGSIAFDSDGNIFVADAGNSRVLKFILATNSCTVSYNLPKFSPCATWNPIPTVFADNETVDSDPYSIFVDTNNTIYVSSINLDKVLVWNENRSNSTRDLSSSLIRPAGVFVTTNGDIYVGNGYSHKRIEKWTQNATDGAFVTNVTYRCRSLFIDINNTLYCSYDTNHKVVKVFLSSSSYSETIVAGNGINGSEADMLNKPIGIFVDFKLNLYVADMWNDRIQLFQHGQLNGTTVAGEHALVVVKLNHPSGVILDTDDYLFIADQSNFRIIRVGPHDFRCLIGCSNMEGWQIYQLSTPKMISFDSYGNIFAIDSKRSRILKFHLATNSCAVSYNRPQLPSCAAWHPNATIFPKEKFDNGEPHNLFINMNNAIYLVISSSIQILAWADENETSLQIISNNFEQPHGFFVTTDGHIYLNNDKFIHRVDRSVSNKSANMVVMNVTNSCFALFIDFTNALYCSMQLSHKVVKLLPDYESNVEEVVAGNDTAGSTSYLLHSPKGIFVDIQLNLYVADSENNRIQLFYHRSLEGITIAGNEAPGTHGLQFPTGVVLDADGYLFIADSNNHRIIRSETNGFRCVVGCFGHHVSASNHLQSPDALWFDSHGNMIVLEKANHRIQKFYLSTKSCEPSSFSMALTCWIPTRFGFYCNISSTACGLLQPCHNDAPCHNIDEPPGFKCACAPGFNGTHCEFDQRQCKPDTCWNDGTCNETSTGSFNCTCAPGWNGKHCEQKVNYCFNVTCENRGVCRPLLLNYSCECLVGSYFGRHCENITRKIVILNIVSQSFAYVAIIAMITVVMFVVIMDILKYCFRIDPVEDERERIRRKKRAKKQESIMAKALKNAVSDRNTLIQATF